MHINDLIKLIKSNKKISFHFDNITIAVDFDGTLCTHYYPGIGEIKNTHAKIIEFLRQAKSKGCKIILWTCRENTEEHNYLDDAVMFCNRNNIPIDYVNENPVLFYPGYVKQRKIYADIYIDDKAINILDF